jgi:DNA recombination protein RmuC
MRDIRDAGRRGVRIRAGTAEVEPMNLADILILVSLGLAAVTVGLLVLLLKRRPGGDVAAVASRLDAIERGQERAEREFRDEFVRGRDASLSQASDLRKEIGATLRGVNDSVLKQIGDLVALDQKQMEAFALQLRRLTESNEKKLEDLRATVESKLGQIQADNAAKLDEMRRTVDEKLEGTLERRLGESFKQVSDRLEQVHKGLGEMQTLASGVGDLKKVLSNVKVRGTWGEIQLGNLLEQILAPSQYDMNVATKPDSAERVEFAVRLPGRDDADGKAVWLPIDAKFPKEDYERLVDASERADAAGVEAAAAQLEARIRAEAKNIHEKYIEPPYTTDFGILYLPTEGLYAEALRRPGLLESLQHDFRVNVSGPTTLAALLNSLQMGFRTLAIQQRSGEVWTLLGAVKTEFRKFGDVIEKVQKKIQEAGNAIESAQVRSRAIERRLKKVEELPAGESAALLAGGESEADEDASEPDGEAGAPA